MSRNLEIAFRSFKESIITLAKTRSLNITPGIYAEIRNILKSFESIKIDNIFVADTEAWRRKYLTGFSPAQSHEGLFLENNICLFFRFICFLILPYHFLWS